MTAIITKTFNNVPFVFREDGWFNMTKAAQHFGKLVPKFLELPSTKEYIDALRENIQESDVYTAHRGRHGGTWAHPKLAVFFARWLDVRFAVWCDAMIEDILKGKAEVTITKPAESAVMALPPEFTQAVQVMADALTKITELVSLLRAPAPSQDPPTMTALPSVDKSRDDYMTAREWSLEYLKDPDYDVSAITLKATRYCMENHIPIVRDQVKTFYRNGKFIPLSQYPRWVLTHCAQAA